MDKNIHYINITDIKNESYGNKGEDFNDSDAYLLFYEKLNNNNCANFNIIKSVNLINKEHKYNNYNEKLNFNNLYEFDKIKSSSINKNELLENDSSQSIDLNNDTFDDNIPE